jgi:inosose dehydratase
MERKVASRRFAGAPISWGVCEVPGWGRQLPPHRVLTEMRSLGLRATELGPVGYLPLDAGALRACLDAAGLSLVAAFVPLVLHEDEFGEARERAVQMAELLAAAGGEIFVLALVADDNWGDPQPLAAAQWNRLLVHLSEVDSVARAHGLRLAVHPHVGTLIERDEAVQRLLSFSDVGWCIDTGHMMIGGTDVVRFVGRHGDRIAHVHLKDVSASIADLVRARKLSLVQATQQGLFRPLGQGDAQISEVVRALDEGGYERWLVLEQDTAITGQEPPDGAGPVLDVRRSIEFLETLAPDRERTVAQS